MLSVLRVGPDPYDPAPSLADLPELLDRVRAAGVGVTVTVDGAPESLSPGAQLCGYRVIQESLTNVLKHATATTAEIALHIGPREFTAAVRDDGRAEPGMQPGLRRPGQGIRGMRERAALYGGTVTAGPRAGGGFEVRLVLPLHERDGEAR
jgi:signal transduction histidine kinase